MIREQELETQKWDDDTDAEYTDRREGWNSYVDYHFYGHFLFAFVSIFLLSSIAGNEVIGTSAILWPLHK